jgi:hypothetical protein
MSIERNEHLRKILRPVEARYQAELECMHANGLLAYECVYCKDANDLLNSRTRNGTVREVLIRFGQKKMFDQIEAFDPSKGEHTPISLKRLAKISGTIFVGSLVVYEIIKHRQGIKEGVVLHLIKRIAKKPR